MTAAEASYLRRQTMGSSFEDMSNNGGILKQKATKIHLQDKEWPIAHCEAPVETGAEASERVTATRVIAGALTLGTRRSGRCHREEGPVQDLPEHHHARRRDPEGSLGFEREEGSGFRKPDQSCFYPPEAGRAFA